VAAVASGVWAWRVVLDDYPVSERARRVQTGDRDERIGARFLSRLPRRGIATLWCEPRR
jgi:hypothetical protein